MRISPFLKWRLLALVLSLLFFISLTKVIYPAYATWVKDCQEIRNLKEQINISTNWQQEQQKLRDEKISLENDLKNISQDQLILSGLSDVLDLINNAAAENHITILELRNSPSIRIEELEKITVTTDFNGSFHDIANFLKKLEMDGNPVQLKYLNLERADKNISGSLKMIIILAGRLK